MSTVKDRLVQRPVEGMPSPEEAAEQIATPTNEPSVSSDEPEETKPDMWADMMEEDEPEDEYPEPESSPDVVAEQEPTGETEGTPEPEGETTVGEAETEVVAETETVEDEAKQEPAPEPVKQQTPEEQKALYDKFYGELQNTYKLSPADAEAIQLNPEEVLPRILAGVHMNVQGQMMQQVQQMMNQVVPQIIAQKQQSEEVENGFYSKWPKLKQHQKEVNNFAGVWRQMNPQASFEDAVENVGKHVMIALGYGLDGTAQQEPVRSNLPPQPAGVSATVPPAPARQLNQFEAIAEELLEEDF